MKRGADTRSLESEEQLFTITLDEALALLAQPKQRGRRAAAAAAPRARADDPVSGKPIVVKNGRFGPYVTDGETNASLRAGDDGRDAQPGARRRAAGGPARARPAPKPRGRASARRRYGTAGTPAGSAILRCETHRGSCATVEARRERSRRAARLGRKPKNPPYPLEFGGQMPYGAKAPLTSETTKGHRAHVTQNQLTELLETEGAKAMLEAGEERGWIEPAELEAFALEHELGRRRRRGSDARARAHRPRGARGARRGEGREGAGRARSSTRPTSLRAPATACSSSSPTSAATSC